MTNFRIYSDIQCVTNFLSLTEYEYINYFKVDKNEYEYIHYLKIYQIRTPNIFVLQILTEYNLLNIFSIMNIQLFITNIAFFLKSTKMFCKYLGIIKFVQNKRIGLICSSLRADRRGI